MSTYVPVHALLNPHPPSEYLVGRPGFPIPKAESVMLRGAAPDSAKPLCTCVVLAVDTAGSGDDSCGYLMGIKNVWIQTVQVKIDRTPVPLAGIRLTSAKYVHICMCSGPSPLVLTSFTDVEMVKEIPLAHLTGLAAACRGHACSGR